MPPQAPPSRDEPTSIIGPRLTLDGLQVSMPSGFQSPAVHLDLGPGDFGLVTGPGGSGKSLLLEALAGTQRPALAVTGKATLLVPETGQSTPLAAGTRVPQIAFVPQDARLAALATDRVSALLGGAAAGNTWLPRLGLHPERLLPLTIRALSAGERKLVLLARALARPFEVLLYDGYGEALDPTARGRVLDLLEAACGQGRIVLMTTREATPAGVKATHRCKLGESEGHGAVPLVRRGDATRHRHEHALIEVQHLTVSRGTRGLLGRLPAAIPLAGVTLFVRHAETLVVLGPSGSGKTTLLEAIAGLRTPGGGRIRISGVDVSDARRGQLHPVQRQIQLVFQDALSVLDADRTVAAHMQEASRLSRKTSAPPIVWLERLGVSSHVLELPADALSASEAARVDLARSLAVAPRAILFDEPRDAAIGTDGGVLTGLIAAEKLNGTSFVLATSEPDIARRLADRIAILDGGRIIEMGPQKDVLERPAHPRTADLLLGLAGKRTDPRRLPTHCPFAASCSRSQPDCETELPHLRPVKGQTDDHHRVACLHPLENGARSREN